MTPPKVGLVRPNKVFGAQINARDAIVYYNKKMYIENLKFIFVFIFWISIKEY